MTEAPTDWSGKYLIVYETGNVAFNGALSTLDAVGNTVNVTISEGVIAYTADLYASTFTIAAVENGYSIMSMSGNYIGQSSYSNGLKQDKSYTHTISLDDSGNANLVVSTSGGDVTLKYNNASNQNRFRYYKSGQKSIALYQYIAGDNSGDVNTDSLLASSMVSKYYNEGVYTKKSEIYLSEPTKFELDNIFVGKANQERTTYYKGDALLMGDLDGSFSTINSGYGTGENKELTHFTYNGDGTVTYDWSLANSHNHKDSKDKENSGMEAFYMTLYDIVSDTEYFENWIYDNGVATYTNEEGMLDNTDSYLNDFIALVAPCLSPIVLESGENDYNNYLQFSKLTISEAKHEYFGDYLRLRIYVTDDCGNGKVDTYSTKTVEEETVNYDFVLAEARIYVGNNIFDEQSNYQVTLKQQEEFGTIEIDSSTSKYLDVYKSGDKIKINVNLTIEDADYYISSVTFGSEVIEVGNGAREFSFEREITASTTVSFTAQKDFASNGITTATTYSFSSYSSGTQYAQGEVHQLDGNTTLTINGAHLNTQVRLYSGSNCVIESVSALSSITINAGNKAATLIIYKSSDGSNWTEVQKISTTTSYTKYDVTLNSANFVKLESSGAQIRVSQVTLTPVGA